MGEINIINYLSIIGTIVTILLTAVNGFIMLKKYKPEVKGVVANTDNINAQTNRISAETIANYAIQLKKMQEEHAKEKEETDKKIDDMAREIRLLRENQEKERSMYRTFITDLLMGINRLIGQIQMHGEAPVWSPNKPPFEL